LLLVLLLALVWMTTLQALVQPKWPWTAWPLASSMGRWGVVAALALAYFVLTRQDFEVLNLSSLHNFYRARIERAYVSVGNYARARASTPALRARFPAGSPLGEVHRASTERVAKLIEAVDGDDIDLARYQPHTHGGPIHLITCCINQSVDDRTGNYNADRQGIALTVSALGAETGTAQPTPLAELPKPSDTGKLSKWIAISGAAASSGMGSQTSPGLAALLFLSGLRLGYWTPKMLPLPVLPSAAGQNPPSRSDRARQWLAMQFPRPSLLMAEFMARFPGLRSATWYVSDGGHFENTGVYALLKRQLDVIVAADCGADPNYRFDDLENMARKAEIDYGATIEFIDPAALVAESALEAALFACVGTVNTVTAKPGPQCLLLARLHYCGRDTPGLLIVVKPRLLEDLPLEISGYAARNERFPQQPTGDQFFDEEQWEAYHQLGLRLGQTLTPQAIAIFRRRLGCA